MQKFQPVGSYMLVSTVSGAIVLVLIIMNAEISACRFLKVESFYIRGFTVLHFLSVQVRSCDFWNSFINGTERGLILETTQPN